MTFQIQLKRTLPVSPERAFALWTDTKLVAQWFCPPGSRLEMSQDVKVGGKHRFEVHEPDGSDYFGCEGEYTVVDPPRRLEFTWKWDESSFDTGVSLVDIEFIPVESGTELILTHTKLASTVSEERHTYGWDAALGRLASYLENNNA